MSKQEKTAVSELIELLEKFGYTVTRSGIKHDGNEIIIIEKRKIYITPAILREKALDEVIACREYKVYGGEIRDNVSL